MNLANEGLEARKKDEEVAAKKRKAEDDKVWEGMSSFETFLFLSLIFVRRNSRATSRQLEELCVKREKEEEEE
jgi:hypothetical protein